VTENIYTSFEDLSDDYVQVISKKLPESN